jgi:hypothetical protein
MKKIIGQKYPAKCLVDHITKKPIMIEHTKDSEQIGCAAAESAKRFMKALNDPTGLTPI